MKYIKIVIAVICAIILFSIILYFTSYQSEKPDNLQTTVEKLILSDKSISEIIMSTNYNFTNISTPSINDTDWHLKIGYSSDTGLYKATISIDDGSITGRSIVSIADINNEKVLCIDFYGAKEYKLIPMGGHAIIPPNSYWYHEIGGYEEVLLIANMSNVSTKYDPIIIDEQSLTELKNTYIDSTTMPGNISQINYNLSNVNGSNYYDIKIPFRSQREVYIVVVNEDTNTEIRIDYYIGPLL